MSNATIPKAKKLERNTALELAASREFQEAFDIELHATDMNSMAYPVYEDSYGIWTRMWVEDDYGEHPIYVREDSSLPGVLLWCFPGWASTRAGVPLAQLSDTPNYPYGTNYELYRTLYNKALEWQNNGKLIFEDKLLPATVAKAAETGQCASSRENLCQRYLLERTQVKEETTIPSRSSRPVSDEAIKQFVENSVAAGLSCRRCSARLNGAKRSKQGSTYLCVDCAKLYQRREWS